MDAGNFSIHHHELNRESYEAKVSWWKDEVASRKRCAKCWLRPHECFCSELDSLKNSRPAIPSNTPRICMYYHYQEIGRSANTAHIFEAINPEICDSFLYGDSNSEVRFLDKIAEEIRTNCPTTCILYPSNDAISLNQWMEKRKELKVSERNGDAPVCIVVLDGTYNQAKRQWKYLTKALQQLHNPNQEYTTMSLPVVKLDLEEGSCKSAILGIMSQPGKDKVCSYQAAVLALRQAGVDSKVCDQHSRNLDVWIQYLLRAKVKFGKLHNKGFHDLDYTPADYVLEYLRNNPPPVGLVTKRLQTMTTKYGNELIRIQKKHRGDDRIFNSEAVAVGSDYDSVETVASATETWGENLTLLQKFRHLARSFTCEQRPLPLLVDWFTIRATDKFGVYDFQS